MGTWMRCASLAAAAALFAPAIAAAGEFKGSTVVPMSKDGIVTVDLQVGPVVIHEVIIQGAPSDPAAIAALPAGTEVAPRPVIVASHRGQEEVDMRLAVSFEGDDGVSHFKCSRSAIEQDEETTNETNRACERLTAGSVGAALWAKVTALSLAVSLVEKD